MHFEVLAEDQSGSIALDIILGKILGANGLTHSWTIHHYKGIGHIPKDLHGATNLVNQLLLDNLPRLLRGYGNSLPNSSAVIVVVDLDDKDCMLFKQELLNVLNACNPRPRTLFRIAIEESEAWLLGDRAAVMAAYPNAKDVFLNNYLQDSICGTWEVLADAVHPRSRARWRKSSYLDIGKAKGQWAREIAIHMDIEQNQSKSFQVFRDGVRHLAGVG